MPRPSITSPPRSSVARRAESAPALETSGERFGFTMRLDRGAAKPYCRIVSPWRVRLIAGRASLTAFQNKNTLTPAPFH